MKQHAEAGANALLMTAEVQGTVFLGSMAEGYFGEDRMRMGQVDLRGAAGVAVTGWGIYEAMNGRNGSHQLAFGNGLLATAIGSYGRQAGRIIAEKKAAGPAAPAPATAPAVPTLQGPLREIAMSGAPEDELAGPRRRARRENSFVPVRVL